ncbi:MAG: UPF0175 family protein [Proteobacteria bacterium]|nr:UPF0175 family protein [Pseudomonadota bacterium]
MKIPEKDVETVLKHELATALYQKGVMSLGKASKIAGMCKLRGDLGEAKRNWILDK